MAVSLMCARSLPLSCLALGAGFAILLFVLAPELAIATPCSGGDSRISAESTALGWSVPGALAPRHSTSRSSSGIDDSLPAEADPLDPAVTLGMGTFSRMKRTGRGQWPRTVYQAPPFKGGFYQTGGVWRTEDPRLALMPFRASFLQEGSGLLGGQFEQRLWSNSIFSGGLELWGLARPNDHGDFYRIEGSFGLLLWLGTQANLELGLLGGIERDVLLVDRYDRRFGYEVGASARMTAWRFELRADWLMRIASERLDTGTLRHSARLAFKFEPLRLGMFGFEVGGWSHFVTGGPPRVGLSAGVRLWFSVRRSEPEYVRRWAGQTRE